MGTRGFYVFKYKEIYYIYYNQFDSSTSWLGKQLVRDFKDIIYANYIDKLKELIIKIPLNDKESNGSIHFTNILSAVKNPTSFAYHTSKEEPHELGIDFIYIFDFDNNEFIVKSGNHMKFNLYNIPDDWEYMFNNNIDTNIKENNMEEINLSDSDDEEAMQLKIKILESNVKIYKMKLILNKKY